MRRKGLTRDVCYVYSSEESYQDDEVADGYNQGANCC